MWGKLFLGELKIGSRTGLVDFWYGIISVYFCLLHQMASSYLGQTKQLILVGEKSLFLEPVICFDISDLSDASKIYPQNVYL